MLSKGMLCECVKAMQCAIRVCHDEKGALKLQVLENASMEK